MKTRDFRAFLLASVIAVNAAMVPLGVAKADAPAMPAPAAVQNEAKSPAQMPSHLSDKLKTQTMDKMASRDQMANVPNSGGARPGEKLDAEQPSVAGLAAQGKLAGDAVNGFAYVAPYMEPNDYAHRNYCGAGAATVVISHFDPGYAQNVDIDQLGEEMNLDPDMGVWIRDITKPVNDHVNELAGQELNWYQTGKAATLDDFRFMLDYDIRQNGVPLITGLYTGGLPGWGGQDVGHIVAVYGYYEDAEGNEFVTYADTAPSASGYEGPVFRTVDLGTFWEAVSGNSAQVW